MWEAEASSWAGAGDSQPEPPTVTKQPSELSPEQLSLVYALFNKVRCSLIKDEGVIDFTGQQSAYAGGLQVRVRRARSASQWGLQTPGFRSLQALRLGSSLAQVDRAGTGQLTPDAITWFLTDLGLEPTSFDVKLIMGELNATRTGAVSRQDFMRFIRNGGRRERSPPLDHTLDRRLSIELDADKAEAAGKCPLRLGRPNLAGDVSRLVKSSAELCHDAVFG